MHRLYESIREENIQNISSEVTEAVTSLARNAMDTNNDVKDKLNESTKQFVKI
jgi:hypothetical protein